MTGWGGVAEAVPFHGFTIFLDSTEQSCIWFEIHLRVDESDAAPRPSEAKSLHLGRAEGWQTTSDGLVNGVRLSNVRTSFSFKRPSEIDDGEVLLVAPTSQMREALRTYDEFLKSVAFGH
jgi:hypothetical protein